VGIRRWYIDDDLDGVCETEVDVLKNSWSVEERMQQRSVLTCTLKDANGTTPQLGKEFALKEDGVLLYGGVIISKPRIKEVVKGTLQYELKIEDFCALTDRELITGVYEQVFIEDVVKDLISKYFSESGITEGTIDADLKVNIIKLNWLQGNEALDYLASFGNFVWNVDKNKQLHFYDLGSTSRPYNLTPLTDEKGFEMQADGANYFNQLYIKGNKRQTVYQERKNVTPKPDSVSREFFTRYDIAKQPSVEIYVSASAPYWVEQTMGQQGKDEGKQFYWAYESNKLSHDESETILTSSDSIRVSYYGLVPLFIVALDSTEIATRGYTHKAFKVNAKLFDTTDALNYASALLEKYANDGDSATFTLQTKDYEVGETFNITKSAPWDIDEDFFVQSCTWKAKGPTAIEYTYKVLDGSSLGGWEEFFKNLFRPDTIEVSDDEVLVNLKQWTDESMKQNGEYFFTMIDPLVPSETLYPSEYTYPGTILDLDYVADSTYYSVSKTVTQDSFVYEYYPDSNYSAWDTLEVYNGGAGDREYALIDFDLASLTGKTIKSAVLKLYGSSVTDFSLIGIKRITSSWDESTVTFNTIPSIDAEVYCLPSLGVGEGWKAFDVTELIQDVANGSAFEGFWVYVGNDPADYCWCEFSASSGSNSPTLDIDYID
jgi:hypothetical protein